MAREKKWWVHWGRRGEVYCIGVKKTLKPITSWQNHQGPETTFGWWFRGVCNKAVEEAHFRVLKAGKWTDLKW